MSKKKTPVVMMSLADADAAFTKAAGSYGTAANRTVAAAWEAIRALAATFTAASPAGIIPAWDHMADLLKRADLPKQVRSKWSRAAAGIAGGSEPTAGESLEAFAKRCPANPKREGGTGERPKGDTPIKRVKALERAAALLGEARERLTVGQAPRACIRALDSLAADVEKALAAEKDIMEAEKAVHA